MLCAALTVGILLVATDQLQGTYRVVAVERDGVKVTEAMLKDAAPRALAVTFRGAEVTAWAGGKEQVATFQLDPTREPPHISMTAQKDGKIDHGIYRFDGDVLTLCVLPDSAKDTDRPTEFKATGKVLILTLKKQPAK